MIQLFQFPRSQNIPSDSPFCMKLESYFRAVNLPYENHFIMDPRQSPTGKIPYISDGEMMMSDSGLIIQHYESCIDSPLQNALTDLEKSQTLAYMRLLEEHLYWSVVYSRWGDAVGVTYWKKTIQKGLNIPKLAFSLMFPTVQKKVLKQLHGHGIGRHSQEQIYLFAEQNLQALSVFLGDKSFFFGEQPTLLDHCSYSFCASIIDMPYPCQLKTAILKTENENLVRHYHNMMKTFFPECLQMTEKMPC